MAALTAVMGGSTGGIGPQTIDRVCSVFIKSRLTWKTEPPPTGDAKRDGGAASANGGRLRRMVLGHIACVLVNPIPP